MQTYNQLLAFQQFYCLAIFNHADNWSLTVAELPDPVIFILSGHDLSLSLSVITVTYQLLPQSKTRDYLLPGTKN